MNNAAPATRRQPAREPNPPVDLWAASLAQYILFGGSNTSVKVTHYPICGLAFPEPVEEDELHYSYWICECCACEYGNDDTPGYRDAWLARGAPWRTPDLRPENWKVQEQIRYADPSWNQNRP